MTGPTISAIIITRNRREVLREALAHLLQSGRGKGISEIIVVDNGSKDGTPEMMGAQFPEVRLIRLPRNLGVPEARNIGALNASMELLLFLDDDGAFDCSCLPSIAQSFYRDERLAVVAFNVIEVKGGKDDRSGIGRTASNVTPSLKPAYTFYGGAAVVKRSPFLEVGMFPGHFLYSHEEDDLSFRLIAKGYRLALCPEAAFIHYRLTKEEVRSRKFKVFHYYRNRQWVIWRNLPWPAASRESLATLIGGAVRTLFTPYFPAFLAGSAAALAGLIRVIRNERSPLSQARYAHYRALGRGSMRYRHRLRGLLLDLFKGRRLDWI